MRTHERNGESAYAYMLRARMCVRLYSGGEGPCGAEMVRFAFISNYLKTDKWKDFCISLSFKSWSTKVWRETNCRA